MAALGLVGLLYLFWLLENLLAGEEVAGEGLVVFVLPGGLFRLWRMPNTFS